MIPNKFTQGAAVRLQDGKRERYGSVASISGEGLEIETLEGSLIRLSIAETDLLSLLPSDGLVSLYVSSGRTEAALKKLDNPDLARAVLLDLRYRATLKEAGAHLNRVFSGSALRLMKANLAHGLQTLLTAGEVYKTATSDEYVVRKAGKTAADTDCVGDSAAGAADPPPVISERADDTAPNVPVTVAADALDEELPRSHKEARTLHEVAREIGALERRLPRVVSELGGRTWAAAEIVSLPDEELLTVLRHSEVQDGELQYLAACALLRRLDLARKNSQDLALSLRTIATRGVDSLSMAVAEACLSDIGRAKAGWRAISRCLLADPELPAPADITNGILGIMAVGEVALAQAERHRAQLTEWVGTLVKPEHGADLPSLMLHLFGSQSEDAPRPNERIVIEALAVQHGWVAVMTMAREAGKGSLPIYEWMLKQLSSTEVRRDLAAELLRALAASHARHACLAAKRICEVADPVTAAGALAALALAGTEGSGLVDEYRDRAIANALEAFSGETTDGDGFVVALVRAASLTGSATAREALAGTLRKVEQERDQAVQTASRLQADVDRLGRAADVLRAQAKELHARDLDDARRQVIDGAIEIVDLLDTALAGTRADPAFPRLRQLTLDLLTKYDITADAAPGEPPSRIWLDQGMYRRIAEAGADEDLVVTRRAFAITRANQDYLCTREGWVGITKHGTNENRS